MRTLLRVALWLLAAVTLLALALGGATAWLTQTAGGARFALAQLHRLAPQAQIEYRALDGRLLGALHVQGLRVVTPDVEITAEDLELDWSPAALLRHEVHVRLLRGRGVQVRSRPSKKASEAGAPRIPQLPLAIALDRAEVDALRIDQGADDPEPVLLRDLALAGTWRGENLHLERVAVTLPETGPLSAQAEATLQADRVRFAALHLRGPGEVDATGTLGLGRVASDLALQLRGLHWPLTGDAAQREVADLAGTARLGGTLDAYRFDADLSATVHQFATQLAARGSGSQEGAQFDDLDLAAAGGTLRGKGALTWTAPLRAELDARIEKLDPALFAPDFKGQLNGHLAAHTVQPRDGDPQVQFTAQLDHSVVRGYPLTLDASGQAQGRVVTLAALKLVSGRSTLTAQGRVTPPFDLAGHFDSADVASLYPGLAGAGAFDFHLDGALETPHVATSGEAGGLGFKQDAAHQYRLAHLQWNADVAVDPKAKQDSHVDLTATGADLGLIVPKIVLSASGREVYHALKVEAQTERGDLMLALQGGYDRRKREWGGELHEGRVTPKPLSALALDKPAGLLLGRKRYSLEPACFAGAPGRVCANVVHNVFGDDTHVVWNLDGLQLAALKALFPDEDRVAGRLDGNGDLTLSHGDLSAAHATLDLTDASFAADGAPPITFLPSHLTLQQTAGRLQAALDLEFPQGRITGEATAEPAGTLLERPLRGRVQMEVPDLAVIEPFVTETKSVGGHLSGDFAVAGTVGAPRVNGALDLKDGHAKLVTPGITLTDVVFTARSDGIGPLALEGSARSGDGQLRFGGSVDWLKLPPRADLKVSGENFQAMDTREARIWIAPDLHLVRDETGVHLDGSFRVPRAQITPQGFGQGGVAPSGDQVIVGAPPAPQKSVLPVFADIDLQLGDDVHIEGFGLKTRLTGGIRIHEEPRRDTSAQGELRLVDGTYQAYGQDLTIESGRLLFNGGAIVEPAIDLYATRHPADDIRVGVKVRGTLDRPELALTSDPAMPREQQLSWLVLGRSLDSSSAQDKSFISSAALSLGLGGGDYLANRIGKSIGLDTISVGSPVAGGSDVAADPNFAAAQGIQTASNIGGSNSAAQSAQLTLGKYLTPKLFVSYGVGLFDSGYVFRLLYDLGHGFKLQGESGTNSGGDVLYTFQRGH